MQLSEEALRVAALAGISEQELLTMARQGTPWRDDPVVNWRYMDWGLAIQADTVVTLCRLRPRTVGHGDSPMYEDCPQCDSQGCEHCGWRGEIVRMV